MSLGGVVGCEAIRELHVKAQTRRDQREKNHDVLRTAARPSRWAFMAAMCFQRRSEKIWARRSCFDLGVVLLAPGAKKRSSRLVWSLGFFQNGVPVVDELRNGSCVRFLGLAGPIRELQFIIPRSRVSHFPFRSCHHVLLRYAADSSFGMSYVLVEILRFCFFPSLFFLLQIVTNVRRAVSRILWASNHGMARFWA